MPDRPPPSPTRRKRRAPRPRRGADASLRARLAHLSPGWRGLLWGAGALLGTLGLALGALLLGYGRHHSAGTRAVEIDWPADLSSEDAAALLAEKGLVE